jgi:CHAT domain-containing protein
LLAVSGRAQDRWPSDLSDGILTAYQASMLDLHGTELVVLSACETGRGKVQDDEGVFGLRRAFQEAGAQSVLMTLWEVPADETQDLLNRFYQHWLVDGMDKHDALHAAQREEREVVRRNYGRDLPYYWGAFILVS